MNRELNRLCGCINALAVLALLSAQYQSGITPNYATGPNNGQIEYFTAGGAPAT